LGYSQLFLERTISTLEASKDSRWQKGASKDTGGRERAPDSQIGAPGVEKGARGAAKSTRGPKIGGEEAVYGDRS
jgi:hypothetical protein